MEKETVNLPTGLDQHGTESKIVDGGKEAVCLSILTWGTFPKSVVKQLWSHVLLLPTYFNDLVFRKTIDLTNIRGQRFKIVWSELQLLTRV